MKTKYILRIAIPLLVFVSGCATIEDFFDTVRGPGATAQVRALKKRPVEEPINTNRFVIESPDQSVVGVPQVVFTNDRDTLSDFAREYGLGYDELIAANPDVDPWLPGANTPILLPTQFVLPDVPREGIVLNIASKRLFYFPRDGVRRDPDTGDVQSQIVLSFPIGIGRVGWETPLGSTTVVSKAEDPSWWVPASVRREHAELGDPLPAVVPPGPENPLGTRVLKLKLPGYLIHGTNQPAGVGMRVSHGCVRLYPENIEFLYELVGIGEPVTIINEPYLMGRRYGEWYFEGHVPLADDTIDPEKRITSLFDDADEAFSPPLKDHVRAIASAGRGVPVRVAQFDDAEVFTRVRRVHNSVEVDPDAPTLEEVREMIDEAVAEASLEEDGV
ncbi:MAG: L,D-transpeptidase family protein [Gammaproteobacteria bacterium]|nr:L,D-transpeptidase family protein [Gammaproteobacteria bacterium]